jgi:hypothetical protein
MNSYPTTPSRQMRRQTFDGVDLGSAEPIVNQNDKIRTPKVKQTIQLCPGAPARNIQHPSINIHIEINPLVLNFDDEEDDRISSPPTKRRRVVSTNAPIKEHPNQSRISEAIEQNLMPIVLQF